MSLTGANARASFVFYCREQPSKDQAPVAALPAVLCGALSSVRNLVQTRTGAELEKGGIHLSQTPMVVSQNRGTPI